MKSLLKIKNFKIGEIIERANRFLVKAKIDNKIVFTHLNNTGRLEEFIRKGRAGIFLPIKGKKTKYRLSMIIDENSQTDTKDAQAYAESINNSNKSIKKHLSILNNFVNSSHKFASSSQRFALKKDVHISSRESSRLFASASIIDTSLQMKCFEIALEKNYISWLRGAKILKRNFRINNSLIDYLIIRNNKAELTQSLQKSTQNYAELTQNLQNYAEPTQKLEKNQQKFVDNYEKSSEIYLLEVKSAVMKRGIYAMYPDCPSIRGQKHIKELINVKPQQLDLLTNSASSAFILRKSAFSLRKSAFSLHKSASILLFIAGMKNIKAFKPNKSADSKIYELLKIARQKGVQIKAIQIYFDLKRKEIILKNNDLKVDV